jgi:hypothetical protein
MVLARASVLVQGNLARLAKSRSAPPWHQFDESATDWVGFSAGNTCTYVVDKSQIGLVGLLYLEDVVRHAGLGLVDQLVAPRVSRRAVLA